MIHSVKIPFRTGDRVLHTKTNTRHIIYEIQIVQTDEGFEAIYSSEKTAWLDHDDLLLVEPASQKSINELINARELNED